MGLLDFATGGKSSDASASMDKALAAIQGVKTPTADEMKYKIQQLVQSGVLTPAQAKTFLQNPSALSGMNIDQTGTDAQKSAIAELLSDAEQGGLNPKMQAQIDEINRQTGTQERGANDAVIQRQAERGALTGGETLAAQLQNNQNATVNANQNAGNTAATAYQQMLNELTTAGSLGGGLQGQENTQANTVGAATDAINKFNTAQQQNTENLNTERQNTAQEYNLNNAQGISNANVANANAYSQYEATLPQTIFNDEMEKANATANMYGKKADQSTQQGGQNAGLLGGLAGTAGQVIGTMYGGPIGGALGGAAGNAIGASLEGSGQATDANPVTEWHGGEIDPEIHNYLNGGEVGGHASVPGDSPKNDTVPAVLSPGEIVLPRSVAHSDPQSVLEFLNRIRAKKEGPTEVHPEDTAHVLKALTLARHKV